MKLQEVAILVAIRRTFLIIFAISPNGDGGLKLPETKKNIFGGNGTYIVFS